MAERKKGTKPERGAADSAPEQKSSVETPAKRRAESKTGAAATKGAKKAAATKPKAKADSSAKQPAAKKPAAKRAPAKKTPAKKAPARRTAAKPTAKAKAEAAKEAPVAPTVRASARYVRVAPRKARHLADQIRGLPIDDARSLLRFSPRDAASDVAKLLDSAAANAENNHDLIADDLMVKEINVNEGPTLRRYRPRALGRATRIDKRTSHISVALTPEEED